MVGKFYSVNHQLLILEQDKHFDDSGTREDVWHWDVYSVKSDDYTKVRCECKSNGRNIIIPWFKTKKLNINEAIREVCLDKMKDTIE